MELALLDKVRQCVRGEILLSEPLKNHTTYRVGGAAEVLVRPRTPAEAARLYALAKRSGIPLTVIGAGSNVIAPDEGIAGIVIATKGSFAKVSYAGKDTVRAEAGVALIDLAAAVARRGLGGLEPISCIPGTVGGAVVMNAGTREGDTGAVVTRVGVCTPPGRARVFEVRELGFGYRTSVLARSDWLVLWTEFRLTPADPRAVLGAMEAMRRERCEKYPLETPSAGSVFKRPPGAYAGRLIEMSGCKGMRVGDAIVSTQHANFIVNAGAATASDILELIARVRRTVYERTGTFLELEQIPLGGHASSGGRAHSG